MIHFPAQSVPGEARSGAEPSQAGGPFDYFRGAFRILAALLVFFSATEVLTIGLSLAQFRVTGIASRLTVLVSALVGYGYWRFLGRESPGPASRHPGLRLGRTVSLLLIFSVVIYVFLWVLAYTLPDNSWDGLWYHNPTIHFWALRGRVHWITTDYCEFWAGTVDPNWNGYPKGVELLGFVLIRATGMVRLLNAFQLPFLLLGILGIFCTSRFLGADTRFSSLAALLFIFVPVNIAQSRTTYVDTATASIYIALLAILCGVVRSVGRGVVPGKLLPALGCGLGMAIAAKGTGILFLPIVLAALATSSFMAWRRFRRGDPAPGISVANNPFSVDRYIRGIISFFLVSSVIAVTVGGYWYLRNYRHTGSPFHPIGLTVLGREVFPGVSMESQFPVPHIQVLEDTEDWPQVKRLAFAWLQGFSNYQDAVTRYASRSGGLGFLWLLAGLPSIVILLFRAVRRRRGMDEDRVFIILMLTAILLILLLVMPKNHNHVARYTIWLYGLGLPAFAVVAQGIRRRTPGLRRNSGTFWIWLAVISILFEGLYALHFHTSLVRDLRLRWQGRERRLPSPSLFLAALRDEYPVGYAWANLKGTIFEEIHSGRETVALSRMYGPHMDGWRMPGTLTQGNAFGKREIYFFDSATTARDPDEMARFLHDRRIRYVIWDKGVRVPRPLARLVEEWHMAGDFYVLEFFPDPAGEGRGI